MRYKVAIDGGASTTRLSVIDEHGARVEQYETLEGTNPFHNRGADKTLAVLASLIDQIKIPRDHVTSCLACISGCQGAPTFNPAITEALSQHFPKAHVKVEGDIRSSYYAVNPAPYGILAIAGSGSAMAILHADNHLYIYDAVSFGGRDAAIQLLSLPLSDTLQTELAGRGIKVTRQPTIEQLYHLPEVLKVASLLPELEHHPEIIALCDAIATRWAYKLWGASVKMRTRDQLPESETIHIVLSGNFWRWERLRQQVITKLTDTSQAYQVHYDPEASSLRGVEIMLQEYYR